MRTENLRQPALLPQAPKRESEPQLKTFAEMFEQAAAEGEAASGRRPARPHGLADSRITDLVRDLRAHDLEHLPGNLFRVVADELAARGRQLQDEHARDPDGRLDQVFRTLTAIAYKRKVFIHGLDRNHEGNWPERARAAREARRKLKAGEPSRPVGAKIRAEPTRRTKRTSKRTTTSSGRSRFLSSVHASVLWCSSVGSRSS